MTKAPQHIGLLDVVFTVIAPSIVLLVAPASHRVAALAIAVLVPVVYLVFRALVTRSTSWATGGLALAGIAASALLVLTGSDPHHIAIKEAILPATIAALTWWSMFTRHSAAEVVFGSVVAVREIKDRELNTHARSGIDRAAARSTFILGTTFSLVGAINYFLARHLLPAGADAAEFNAQLGRYTLLSTAASIGIVLVLGVLAALVFAVGVSRAAQLPMSQVFRRTRRN